MYSFWIPNTQNKEGNYDRFLFKIQLLCSLRKNTSSCKVVDETKWKHIIALERQTSVIDGIMRGLSTTNWIRKMCSVTAGVVSKPLTKMVWKVRAVMRIGRQSYGYKWQDYKYVQCSIFSSYKALWKMTCIWNSSSGIPLVFHLFFLNQTRKLNHKHQGHLLNLTLWKQSPTNWARLFL